MFFLSGDLDPRDNLPGRPALDFFMAAVFAIGIVVSVARWKKPAYALLLIWLTVMTLPSALTEFAPNFRRAIGAMPAVILLCAVGLNWIVEIGSWKSHSKIWRFAVAGLLALGLAFSAWSSFDAYFFQWARGVGLYYSFDAGLLNVARALAARPANEQLCLSPDYHDHPTVLWALDGRAFSTFDGRRVAVLPDSALATTCAIITHEDQQFSPTQFFPGAAPLATIDDFDQQPYAQIFHIPAGASPTIHPQQAVNVRVGENVRLLGADIARATDHVDLRLYWRAEGALHDDYTVFVHLVGPANPSTGSTVWAQADSQPGGGTYPTSRWRTSEILIDPYTLKLPTNAPKGTYQVEVGMYLLSTGARLAIFHANGTRVDEDAISLAAIPIP
jgi:hypothetical protein